MGKGHSSNSKVMTAGPSGSSNGITRIRDWTTSSQPSSKREERQDGALASPPMHLGHRAPNGVVDNGLIY